MADYITLVTGQKPVNKQYSLDGDTVIKKPGQVYDHIARTQHVPDQAAFLAVLDTIADDPNTLIILGYIPGTEEIGEYRLLSRKKLKALGCIDGDGPFIDPDSSKICYTRATTTFTSSTWMLLEYDRVPLMPEELIYTDRDTWWTAMIDLFPALATAGVVFTPSASEKVLLDGEPLGKGGFHAFVQVDKAADIPRFYADLLINALAKPFGFMRQLLHRSGPKEGEPNGATRPWAIFDPCVYAPERLVY